MDCPECNAIMEAEEIKFGWNQYTCPDCDYIMEGLAYDDYMDMAEAWSDEQYDRLYKDLYAPDYPRDVVKPLPKVRKPL